MRFFSLTQISKLKLEWFQIFWFGLVFKYCTSCTAAVLYQLYCSCTVPGVLQLCCTSCSLNNSGVQVNSEIFSDQDLLAIDSGTNIFLFMFLYLSPFLCPSLSLSLFLSQISVVCVDLVAQASVVAAPPGFFSGKYGFISLCLPFLISLLLVPDFLLFVFFII